MTNRAPTGLNRGFGGPQLYTRARAHDVHRRAPARARPGRASRGATSCAPSRCPTAPPPARSTTRATTARASSGRSSSPATTSCAPSRRAPAPRGGCSASASPASSSRASPTWATSRSCRAPRSAPTGLPKSGSAEGVTIAMGPHGGVTLRITTTPQGQGHRTVAAQVAADVLGLDPEQIDVRTDADTAANPWTVSSGNYSSRFSAMGASAVHLAATRLADAPARARRAHARRASATRSSSPAAARACAATRSAASRSARLAGASHWHPSDLTGEAAEGLALTVTYTLPIAPPDDGRPRQLVGLLRLRGRRLRRRDRSRDGRARPCATTSRCTTPGACSTRCWPRARSAAASPTASAPRCSRSTATTRTATS